MSYYDEHRKALEFQEGHHVFLRVTPVTSVVRALKTIKLTPRFIGPYLILQRVGEVACKVALPLPLLNFHDIFHVSQLRKYIPNSSHVIQLDDVQVRDKVTIREL